jgi:uncharacterized Zn finger protein
MKKAKQKGSWRERLQPPQRSREFYDNYPPPAPPPADGIKLRASRRPVAQGEITRQLEQVLERSFDERRLAAGAALAREGRIRRFSVAEGVVSAQAVGSERYRLSLYFDVFAPEVKMKLLEAMVAEQNMAYVFAGGNFLSWADNLVSEISNGIDELVPLSFRGKCSCLYGQGCKHVAALSYLLIEAVDEDELLLLQLYGLPPAQLQKIRKAVAEKTELVSSVEPASFWSAQEHGRIVIPTAEREQVLARLQPPPPEISKEAAQALMDMLATVLAAAEAIK